MTDKELRDAAVYELERTTVSGVTYRQRLADGKYPDPLLTRWGKALDLLGQIGTTPPPVFGGLRPAPLPVSLGDGGTVFIAPNGNDSSGNGTQGSPWKTPHKAFQQVALTGGRVECAPGTYLLAGTGDGANQTWARNGSHTNPPQIRCSTGVAHFQGSRLLVHHPTTVAGGLRIGPGLRISGSTYDGIKIERSDGYVEIVGCEIDANNENGILVGYTQTPNPVQVQIRNCRIHHNGQAAASNFHGVYFGHANNTCLIENTVMYDNAAFGAQLGPRVADLTMTCCTLYGTIAANGMGGLATWTQSPYTNLGTRYFGCIVANVPGYPAWSVSGSVGAGQQINDSISYQCQTPVEAPTSWVTATNLITGNPMFVNAAARDLRIGAGSAATNLVAANPGWVPPTDINGNPRVTADAGAYAA
jgi:hypothetical protein